MKLENYLSELRTLIDLCWLFSERFSLVPYKSANGKPVNQLHSSIRGTTSNIRYFA